MSRNLTWETVAVPEKESLAVSASFLWPNHSGRPKKVWESKRKEGRDSERPVPWAMRQDRTAASVSKVRICGKRRDNQRKGGGSLEVQRLYGKIELRQCWRAVAERIRVKWKSSNFKSWIPSLTTLYIEVTKSNWWWYSNIKFGELALIYTSSWQTHVSISMLAEVILFEGRKTFSFSFFRMGSVRGREPQLGVPSDPLLRQEVRRQRRLHLQDADGQEELRQRRRHRWDERTELPRRNPWLTNCLVWCSLGHSWSANQLYNNRKIAKIKDSYYLCKRTMHD